MFQTNDLVAIRVNPRKCLQKRHSQHHYFLHRYQTRQYHRHHFHFDSYCSYTNRYIGYCFCSTDRHLFDTCFFCSYMKQSLTNYLELVVELSIQFRAHHCKIFSSHYQQVRQNRECCLKRFSIL